MRRFGLPILPCIIGVILGPFAEEKLRQALQISNGDIGGLIDPISVVVYCIVGLILLWPLVGRFVPRKAVPSVLEEAAHDIEEAHHHHGLTTAVSVERHAGDRPADRPREAPDVGEPKGR
jgi:putative tricarboxylic transport membrane protein